MYDIWYDSTGEILAVGSAPASGPTVEPLPTLGIEILRLDTIDLSADALSQIGVTHRVDRTRNALSIK